MINHSVIEGNLTYDPVLRNHAKSGAFLTFSIANEVYVKGEGDGNKHVNYIDCVMFGKRAEALANLLKQGTRVVIDGELHYSSWEKDGAKKSKLELRVNDISFMTKKSEAATDGLADKEIQF